MTGRGSRSGSGTRGPSPAPSGTARRFVVIMLCGWMVLPFLLQGNLGQDGVPYLVAGELVTSQPDEVYAGHNDPFDLRPIFAERYCRLAPAGTDCPAVNVAYVSLPQALPAAVVISRLGADGGILLMRLLGAACLAGGVLALWDRLAGISRRAPALLAITVALLTPYVMLPLALAQTSPLLFLGAALGLGARERTGRGVATSAAWVGASVLKAFPIVLGVVLLRQRRWRLLGFSAAWFALLSGAVLVVGPPSLFGDFVRTSLLLNDHVAANPDNGSVDALAHAIAPALTEGLAAKALLVARFLAAGGVWWWAARDADDDQQWAFAWLALLLVVPLLWLHYLWIAVAAVGLAIAARRDADRWLPALPLTAAAILPLAILDVGGTSLPVVQALLMLAAIGFTGWLLRTAGDRRPATATVPPASDE